jgi:hypothetical protein
MSDQPMNLTCDATDNGWVCNQPPGHTGDHMNVNVLGEVLWMWPIPEAQETRETPIECPRCLTEADHSPDEKVCSDRCITRYRAAAERQAAEIVALRAERQQWQPIETAQAECENGEPYLVYHPDWGMSVQWFAEKGTYRGFNWRADPGTAEPTHWMPLPDAPSSEGQA